MLLLQNVSADSAITLITIIGENEGVSSTAATERLYCEAELWKAKIMWRSMKGQFFRDSNCSLDNLI